MLWRILILIAAMTVLAVSKDRIVHAVKDPNISLLFMAIGLTLIYTECLRPGSAIFASIGGVLILVGMFGFTMQEVSSPWMLALLVGSLMIMAEAFWPMHGIAAIGGLALVNFAGVKLCAGMRLNWTVPILTAISGLTLFVLRFASIAWSNKHVAITAMK